MVMPAEHLTQEVNALASLPPSVIFQDLVGANVELATDPGLEPDAAALDLQPPDTFQAVLGNEGLLVTNMPDRKGGTARLRVGPGEQQINVCRVNIQGGDASARGTVELPLRIGILSLATTDNGNVFAEHVVGIVQHLVNPNSPGAVEVGSGLTGFLIAPAGPSAP